MSIPLYRLDSHPSARNRAVSTAHLEPGATVQFSTPLATALIESEKGKRCDCCLFLQPKLQRCTGCQLYWYCDKKCQLKAWKAHHKRLCPRAQKLKAGLSLSDDSTLLHCLLLANILIEYGDALKSALELLESRQRSSIPDSEDHQDPIIALLTLLPEKSENPVILEFLNPFGDENLIAYVSSRFARNNFALYSSRMNALGHGVFPLASRTFNHSCFPNAVPIYRFSKFSGVQMEIKVLRTVGIGEEITIPYIDPALPILSRRVKLKDTYGFVCDCVLCLPSAERSRMETSQTFDSAAFESTLKAKVLPLVCGKDRIREDTLMSIRDDWLKIIPSIYLPTLSEQFSNASHMGSYPIAIESGRLLLALYCITYPMNFPMIGLHALELAKTCWNSFATNSKSPVLDDMKSSLKIAQDTFQILYGNELDKAKDLLQDGILEELWTLRDMLASDL